MGVLPSFGVNKGLIIYGIGGQSRVTSELAESLGYEVLGYVDFELSSKGRPKSDSLLPTKKILSHQQAISVGSDFIIAIGDNWTRQQVREELLGDISIDRFPSLIHPSAFIASTAFIGKGTIVLPFAFLGSNARIGDFCILNTRSSIDHDSLMDDFSSLAPNSTLGGKVHVGNRSAILISATVSNGVTIDDDTVVGACSLVLEDAPRNAVLVGTPARILRTRESSDSYM